MGIVKSGRICSVKYPNGNVANLTLGEVDRYHVKEDGTRYLDPFDRNYAVENNKLFKFDLPEPTTERQTITWEISFSGKFEGENLPKIECIVTMFGSSQVGLQIRCDRIHDKILINGINADAFLYFENIGGEFPRHWYFGIGIGNDNSDEFDIFAGVAQGDINYMTSVKPFCDASTYFSVSNPVEYNPTMGTITNPDLYESKPNDASSATMEDSSDIIDIDELPSAVYAGGLFRIYELSNVQMTTLSNELTDPSIIESLVRTVTSPLDYVVSLKAMPATFEGFSTSLRLGNYTSEEVGSVKQLNNFIYDIDCGSVTIPTFFDSFLDWSPYTNATLYLPFVGYVSLNLDKFIGDVLKIKYRVDAVSGDCIAFISNTRGLIATYSGNCSYNLPLRANDSSAIVAGLYSALSGLVSGNAGQFAQGSFQLTEGVYKPNMVSTSGLSANAGSMCNRKPYLIIERPRVSLPKSYPNNIGYMCRISAKLSSVHGYTEVEAIHLDNVIATREEKAELEALLRNGVVLP